MSEGKVGRDKELCGGGSCKRGVATDSRSLSCKPCHAQFNFFYNSPPNPTPLPPLPPSQPARFLDPDEFQKVFYSAPPPPPTPTPTPEAEAAAAG
ncbi:hypothetical protein M0804_012509 [Polistes exclamans]|nr:hypothetical protein M0804_012509 [Polistes exclamans]